MGLVEGGDIVIQQIARLPARLPPFHATERGRERRTIPTCRCCSLALFRHVINPSANTGACLPLPVNAHNTQRLCQHARLHFIRQTRHLFMASSKAHHATGWAAGLIAAAVVSKAGAAGPYHVWGILSFCAGVFGGTAPDWLEVAWWTRARRLWITHRTLTHWGVGCACGGLMHLFADWPNPLGVPWLVSRHSLNWWNSGRCDALIVGAAWIAAAFAVDHVWFHSVYGLRLLHVL